MLAQQGHPWLQNLDGVDALAILTDADLSSHKNGHALFYDGIEPLENDCIIISADPEHFLENLKNALQTRIHTLAHTCTTAPAYATSLKQLIAVPILNDQTVNLVTGTCTIRPIYVRKRSDRDTRQGDTLLFVKEYHFNLGALLYTASWLCLQHQPFSDIPTDGNVARVERTDVIRFTNDYYTYESGRPQLQDEQTQLKDRHCQVVVVHNHLSYWTPVFKETWSFFPQYAPYQKTSHNLFREELWEAAKSGYLCDVLIQSDDFEIPAHSIVLRTVPYYRVMFASMMSEGLESRQRHYQRTRSTSIVVRENDPQVSNVQVLRAPPFASEDVLRGFLYYVYMGRLPLDVFVSGAYALDMILVADFYNSVDLVRDAVHGARIEDPALATEIADAIEQTAFAEILRARAKTKSQKLEKDEEESSR